jgi:hypothetical protein
MSEKVVNPVSKMLEPFPANEINQIPKGGIQLDYVGHAALTKRLLETDLEWSWEPFAVGEDGLPKLDDKGGLWIRLTVCGITRIGYGDAGNSKGTNAVKEAIGDALRNAGMRFGAALDLWHKGDLFDLTESRGNGTPEKVKADKPAPRNVEKPTYTDAQIARANVLVTSVKAYTDVEKLRKLWSESTEFLDIPVDGTTLKDAINSQVSYIKENEEA